jgi:c(7)-type cytochrome triheme protein
MRVLIVTLLCGLGWAAAQAQTPSVGKATYESACAACHGTGILGAPKLGDKAAWAARTKTGIDGLVKSAIAGTAKGMPPRGGRTDLTEAQLRAAIEHMMGGGVTARAAAAPPVGAAASTSAPPASAIPVIAPPAPVNAAAAAEVNAFNRLLKPLGRVNRPAAESGIHDPANDMTLELQPPRVAFSALPKSLAGNHVDWVKALDSKAITPRWDRVDPAAAAIVMDLNIIREVKGSMPDVVYPHKQHTEWLDCSNCHPKIFVPQKGANQISMASILLGQQCGVCHGKVAFPVSECRLCHSRKKATPSVAGVASEAKP